jgi:hypothetical protein
MATTLSANEAQHVLEYVEQHRDAFPGGGRLAVTLHREVYLSTLYKVARDGQLFLLALKHHDPSAARARREYEVLSVLGSSLSARPVLFDDSRSWFADPILVTTFERPSFVKTWTDVHLARLAQVMAAIHTNDDLLDLPIDRGRPRSYSLLREFDDEMMDVPSFRDTPLRRTLLEVAEVLRERIPRWETAFADGPVTYIHSDLPHSHLFAVEPQWKTVHWEWSRRSHPSRELARAFWDMDLPPDRERLLVDQYLALVPYTITGEALETQRLLQYFYNCVHVAFWLDRTEQDPESATWRKAERLAAVVRLWIQMRLEQAA